MLAIADDVPSTKMPGVDFDGAGVTVVDIVSRAGLATSKSEARRLVQQGGVKVNDERCARSERRGWCARMR